MSKKELWVLSILLFNNQSRNGISGREREKEERDWTESNERFLSPPSSADSVI